MCAVCCAVWCVVWCVLCGVWCVVCGAWCVVVCGVCCVVCNPTSDVLFSWDSLTFSRAFMEPPLVQKDKTRNVAARDTVTPPTFAQWARANDLLSIPL